MKVAIQGSTSTNSEQVVNVFYAAWELDQKENGDSLKSNNVNNPRNVDVVIFFDEMGLAENSKNNPLKVIHSLLI